MALTRYLGWVLLPVLVWSLGGAWIEGANSLLRTSVCMHDSYDAALTTQWLVAELLATGFTFGSYAR